MRGYELKSKNQNETWVIGWRPWMHLAYPYFHGARPGDRVVVAAPIEVVREALDSYLAGHPKIQSAERTKVRV